MHQRNLHKLLMLILLSCLVYGMTEAMRLTVHLHNEKRREGSVGVFVPGVEGKVGDFISSFIKYYPVFF